MSFNEKEYTKEVCDDGVIIFTPKPKLSKDELTQKKLSASMREYLEDNYTLAEFQLMWGDQRRFVVELSSNLFCIMSLGEDSIPHVYSKALSQNEMIDHILKKRPHNMFGYSAIL